MSKSLNYTFFMEEFIKLFGPNDLTDQQKSNLYAIAKEFDLTIADVTEFQKLKAKQNDTSRT